MTGPIILTAWQKEILAARLALNPDEIERMLNGLNHAEQRRRDGPCNCPGLPWPDHKHHYQLTDRGLT